MNRTHRKLVLVMAALLLTTLASPATARSSVEVTNGTVQVLPGAEDLGYALRGGAIMVRFAEGTLVAVRVRGLSPSTSYPTHVHNAPCSHTPPGGSHYQHIEGGPVDVVNEIWPVVTTNERGAGWGTAWHDHRARPDAQAIVIHYPADTSIRLACIDLD
ncbi:MAG: hypothetical protein QNJ88_07360 [Acidimicrobiia bacterium]|nr:hypothetical protein [Acidimicrobiia bacterium]